MRLRTRTAVAALCLVALVAVIVLAYAEQRHTFVSFAVAVIPVACSAVGAIAAWWRRGSRAPEGTTTAQLTAAADWLAEATAVVWRQEAAKRRIITPAPASVRWRWAAGNLAPPRGEVMTPPVPGTGPPPLPDLAEPGEILGSGVVTRLYKEVYARLPHGRLVMVGGPGSGKTGAMILLMLAALEQRASIPGDVRQRVPVPAWLTLGSWNPEAESLHDWAADMLNRDYPALRAPEYGADAAGSLVRGGRVALFLDGLDEMPPDLRSMALRQINTETAERRVVITSRPSEYRLAVEDATMDNVAVIELRPVRTEAAAAYLLYGQSGPSRAHWEQFCDYLRDNPASVAARALDNPLTLSLARDAYVARDPAVLADPVSFPGTNSLTAHLLDQFLITAYPDDRQRAYALRWLSWVAWHMGTGQDLQWWDIPNWVSRWKLRLARGLVTGLVVGALVSVMSWLSYQALKPGYAHGFTARIAPGVGAGIGFALLAALVARLAPRTPVIRTPVPLRQTLRHEIHLLRRLGSRNWLMPMLIAVLLVAPAIVLSVLQHTQAVEQVVIGLLIVIVVIRSVAAVTRFPRLSPSFLRTVVTRAITAGLAAAAGIMAWAWLYHAIGLGAAADTALGAGIVTVGVCIFAFGVWGRRGFGLGGSPQTLTPRWPRPGWLAWLYLPLLPLIVPILLNTWATPAAGLMSSTPSSTYRADRRTSVIYACAYALLPGIPVGGAFGLTITPIGSDGIRALLVFGWAVTGAAVTWLLAWQVAGRMPLVTLTQVVLRFRSGGSVSFVRLLDDALERQVLRQAGAVYQFRHATLQSRLAARYRSQPHSPTSS